MIKEGTWKETKFIGSISHIYRERRISPCLLILGRTAGCVSWSREILARHEAESGVLPGKLFEIRKRNLSSAVMIP